MSDQKPVRWIDVYAPVDTGTGTPYTGSGRQGDTRGAGREATQGSKHGFTRGDMARSTKQTCDGSRRSK